MGRDCMNKQGKTEEEFFNHVAGGETSSEVLQDKFLAFVASSLPSVALEDGKGPQFFRHIVGGSGDDVAMSRKKFMGLLRLLYRVVKPAVLTEALSIKSKTTKRLEVGEVVEAMEGPMIDESTGVQRVKCKPMRDSASGWVTVAGNQGTVFLARWGNCMTCMKETTFTDGLSTADSRILRKVQKGEVVEVIEFFTKDEAAGVMRIQGTSKVDGTIGWVTVAGQGDVFLEPS